MRIGFRATRRLSFFDDEIATGVWVARMGARGRVRCDWKPVGAANFPRSGFGARPADLEIGDTADWEVCGTRLGRRLLLADHARPAGGRISCGERVSITLVLGASQFPAHDLEISLAPG